MIFEEEWELLRQRVTSINASIGALKVSPNLVLMLIAAEDHRYGRHPGVDPLSVARAAWRSVFTHKREGASTIAMQLVRVATGRYERTIKRKIVEMYLALRLTRDFHQSDIPRFYLAAAYYGWKMNGLRQASKRLRLDLSSLSETEAASVVARLKYPEPRQLTKKRRLQIEQRTRHILSRADWLRANCASRRINLSNLDGAL